MKVTVAMMLIVTAHYNIRSSLLGNCWLKLSKSYERDLMIFLPRVAV